MVSFNSTVRRLTAVSAALLVMSIAQAISYTIGGTQYAPVPPGESGNALFTAYDGWDTTGTYSNFVEVTVSGEGQSAGAAWNDAFYVFANGAYGSTVKTPISPYHPNPYYQLNIGKVTLTNVILGWQAPQRIIFDIDANHEVTTAQYGTYVPAYRSDHTYRFIVYMGATPSVLHFGNSDGQLTDNAGSYDVTVHQLGLAPIIDCNQIVGLWAPNHDLVDVQSAFTVSMPDGSPVTYTIRVFSDESEVPETGDGTGKHAPDFKDEHVDGRGIIVRAERAGNGNGRVYIGEITATSTNYNTQTVEWCILGVVPHDDTQESMNLVLTEAYAALASPGPLPNSLLPYEHGLAAPLGPKQ